MTEALETIRLDNPRKLAADVRVTASVRSALIEALAYYLQQSKAAFEGKPYDVYYFRSVPHEWLSQLMSYVIALEDEAAIPVLLQTSGSGSWASDALLDFGPMVVTPAIECAENDANQYMTVVGCMEFLSTAVNMWRDSLNENEVARLHALTRRRLSKPLAAYPTLYGMDGDTYAARYIDRAANLALALGWTDEYRALAFARLAEINPERPAGGTRESILNALVLGRQVPSAALSEDEVVLRLTSRNILRMMDALETIRLDKPGKLAADVRVSAPVRSALIEALAYYKQHRKARFEGKPYDEAYVKSTPDHWQSQLESYVIALEDEAAIPVLLQPSDGGLPAVHPLLDFGPMVVLPAIECAENHTHLRWDGYRCMELVNIAVYMWRDRLNENEVARLHALTRRHLSKPLAAYPKGYSSAFALYVNRAAVLALVLGWTDEYRALAHARMEEIDPKYFRRREAILDALTGKTLTSFEEIERSRRQRCRNC